MLRFSHQFWKPSGTSLPPMVRNLPSIHRSILDGKNSSSKSAYLVYRSIIQGKTKPVAPGNSSARSGATDPRTSDSKKPFDEQQVRQPRSLDAELVIWM